MTRIDASERSVTLATGGTVGYDYLIYAVGSGSADPEVPGAALGNRDGRRAGGGGPDRDPALRRFIALDPHANPELVDRLSTDPDATVRQAMASSPRLPAPRITALLNDPELAEAAGSVCADEVARRTPGCTRSRGAASKRVASPVVSRVGAAAAAS
ncbi:hypothetical protein ACVCAH_25565 [Micromonospora sp. LZ34]